MISKTPYQIRIVKIRHIIFASLSLSLPLTAEFESWTNKDGKSVEMELSEVTGEGEEKAGVFVMRNGRKVSVKKADLNGDSAKKLDAWKPVGAGKPSVFDEVIEGNLVALEGTALKDHTLAKKPEKYYVFYYTASWCGPCRSFTPRLVEFYNKNKNDNFEMVLISSDRDEKSMETYAEKNKMPWPHLKFNEIKTFKSKFAHGVRGIPSVIVCDLEGKIVTSNGRDLNALEQLVK
jgi:thiol-disulfide isomerase/thioredoxin